MLRISNFIQTFQYIHMWHVINFIIKLVNVMNLYISSNFNSPIILVTTYIPHKLMQKIL